MYTLDACLQLNEDGNPTGGHWITNFRTMLERVGKANKTELSENLSKTDTLVKRWLLVDSSIVRYSLEKTPKDKIILLQISTLYISLFVMAFPLKYIILKLSNTNMYFFQ